MSKRETVPAKERKYNRAANPQPTPDEQFSGRGDFLYRHGKQIGLDWDGLRARQQARQAEEAATARDTKSTLPLPEVKKRLTRKKKDMTENSPEPLEVETKEGKKIKPGDDQDDQSWPHIENKEAE